MLYKGYIDFFRNQALSVNLFSTGKNQKSLPRYRRDLKKKKKNCKRPIDYKII